MNTRKTTHIGMNQMNSIIHFEIAFDFVVRFSVYILLWNNKKTIYCVVAELRKRILLVFFFTTDNIHLSTHIVFVKLSSFVCRIFECTELIVFCLFRLFCSWSFISEQKTFCACCKFQSFLQQNSNKIKFERRRKTHHHGWQRKRIV